MCSASVGGIWIGGLAATGVTALYLATVSRYSVFARHRGPIAPPLAAALLAPNLKSALQVLLALESV